MALTGCLWINDPMAAARAEYKPVQLAAASAVGLRIPDTLITSDPDAAYRWARNLGKPVIYKPLSGVWHADESQVRVIYTTVVDDIETLRDPALGQTAHLFQEQVPKAFEARAVVVADQVFTVRIDASSDSARQDWRSDYDALTYTLIQLPAATATALVALLQRLGLVYGAVDLICRPSGDWVFLELNQAGEWGWLAGATGVPIAGALADLMTGRQGISRSPVRRPARLPPPGQESTLACMDAVLWADRSDAELVGAERSWMLGVLQMLIPDLLASTGTRPTGEMPVKDPLSWPLDGPDTLAGVLQVGGVEDRHPREVLYSRTGWRRLLAALDKSPALAEIEVHVFGADGKFQGGGKVSIKRSEFEPGWVRFGFSVGANVSGWPWSPATQDRWAQLLRDQAARIGASTGFMTDTGEAGQGLSEALRRPGQRSYVENPDASITRSRQVLQDYCWATIVPAELVRRLGGATALRGSGAFCDVSELPDGSVWLRVTPTINEFTGERITAVFRTLAPVLLTGRTEFSFGYRRLVEHADAADYQRATR
jgi:hypothetical protein